MSRVRGRVLTNEEIDAILEDPWTVHITNYEDIARTLDVLRRSAKAWHKLADARLDLVTPSSPEGDHGANLYSTDTQAGPVA